jgi:predicted MFS family arabinose efflux permease
MALVLSYSSDRWQERKWHMLVPTFLAGVFMILAAWFGQEHLGLLLLCLTLTAAFWFGRITMYWILVADAVPKDAAGPSMAIANGVGNFGGFLGPFIFGWLRSITDSFDAAMIFGGVAFIAAALIAVPLRVGSQRPLGRAMPAPTSTGH